MYDEDERIASQAAATMCERGFENLFMLSGGESCSCPHVCMNICMNLKPHSEASYFILFHLGLEGLKVIAQKFPEGMSTGLFPVTCLPTLRGPSGQKHAAFPQTQQPAEDKQRFTSEDLDKIQHYLQEVFLSSEGSSE